MARSMTMAWLAALLLAACGADDGPFLWGTISVNPCPPGPTADACELEEVPPDCEDYVPQWSERLGGPLPEPGASIELTGTERNAITDSNGEFTLSAIEPGTVTLSVSVPWTEELRESEVIEVLAEQVDSDYGEGVIDIAFTAAGDITGQVALPRTPPRDDHEYGGLEAVEVQLACPPRTAVTDAEGRFRFDFVPQGTRHLTATGIGLVGTARPVQVLRGETSPVAIQLEYGRPPDQPGNTPPVIDAELTLTPLPDVTSGTTAIRPPFEGLVRGERAALTCSATDADGDILQYVWSASSGALEADNDPEAVLTAGREDAGVSCTVLDGRGGVDAVHRVIPVLDPYFAGATLLPEGALVSVAYGDHFDLVHWTPSGGARIDQAGDQWLPRASGNTIAYVDHAAGLGELVVGEVVPGGSPLISVEQAASGVTAFAVADAGVAWVDAAGVARFRTLAGVQSTIASGIDADRIAASSDTVAVSRWDAVELYRVDAGSPWLADVILTPSRVDPGWVPFDPDNSPMPFSTDGTRVAYWSYEGDVLLATGSGETEIADEGISDHLAGRIELSDDYLIYSFYESPLRFIEATVVWLSGDQPLASERVAIGPSEVLDRIGDRLLLGRPRSGEAEPSAELWLLDLSTVEVVP